MNKFYPLKIEEIRQLTSDSVEIKFQINSDISEKFQFKAGQYITIKHEIDGDDIRRAYSLCSDPNSSEIAVGVKMVENGKMSTFLTKNVKEGDVLEVMPPSGNFVLEGENVVGICAGSGITPILSMLKSGKADFKLVYGNKTESSTMFYEEIKEHKSDNYFVFSREEVEGSLKGRINSETLDKIDGILDADAYYICGPGEMIEEVSEYLIKNHIEKSKIHFEKFSSSKKKKDSEESEIVDVLSDITVIMDDEEFEYKLSSKGESILDSAMQAGADIPFSCKGGVCCTCKAKVMEGKAVMSENYALSEDEVRDGYILTCKAHPVSEKIIVDFDIM